MPAEPVEISLEPKPPDLAQPARRYEKAAYVFMALLIAYSLVRGIFGAAGKPFWIDEFCTLAVAMQPGIHGILDALHRGVDSAPPLFYLIEKASLKLIGNRELALRLPSIVAFSCMLLCVFAFLRRRSGDLIACLCSLLFFSTTLFTIYSTDGRSYGMVIACIAFAMVCYQRLPSARWTALLALSLIVAESLHYFAVFAMAPFWLAEGVALLRARRVRWAVWLALACGLVPLVAFWPLLASYRSFYGAHIVFSHPPLGKIPEYWGSYFLVDPPLGAGLALVALAAILWTLLPRDGRTLWELDEKDLTEGTLLIGLVALPVIAFVLVRLSHAILTNRYMLASILGVAAGAACALSLARPKIVALFAMFLVASIGLREYGFWRNGHHAMGGDLTTMAMDEFPMIERFVDNGGHRDLPVVYGSGLSYARIAYYSPADWNRRMVYLLDEEKELANIGNDTLAKIFLAIGDVMPFHLQKYSEFTKAHDEFLVFTDDQTDFATVNLIRDAQYVKLLEMEGPKRLYLVKMSGAPEN